MRTRSLSSHLNHTRISNRKTQVSIVYYFHISKTVKQLKETHTLLIKSFIKPNQYHILSHLLTQLLQLSGDNLIYANRVFDQIPKCTNPFLWTSLIRCHVHCHHFRQSIILFAQMHRLDVPPSKFTFSSVLNACARIPAIKEGKQMHKRLVQSGFLCNKIVQTALLDMYAKCRVVGDACRVFDTMEGKDVVAWTAMICTYTKMSMMEDARRLFDEMEDPNMVSWTAMVAGYASCGEMSTARELYDRMVEKNSVTGVAIISGYGKCGDVNEARRVFEGIVERDASCWAAMVVCYSQNGCAKEAAEVYKEMRERNVRITDLAMVGAISACAQLGDVELANTLAKNVEEGCCCRTLVISNALMHMYAKCGFMDEARREFSRMKEKDVISYSTIITALADHGKYQEALDVFSLMQKDGIRPNQVTFVGILNACSYGGMIEEGCKHFELMTQVFGIKPMVEHLTCMISLLGRAGLLENAYNLVVEYMGVGVSDAGIWGALLGACNVHGNTEIGGIASWHLSQLEPEGVGNFVLLANTYGSTKQWDDAESMRKTMSQKGLKKFPGCSWIPSSYKK